MRLTYLCWGYPYEEAILRAWEKMGVTVKMLHIPDTWLSGRREDTASDILADGPEQKELFRARIQAAAGEMIFTVNFFAGVSQLCVEEGIVYCCWVLQLPNFDLYTQAVLNPVNLIYVCDSYLMNRLRQTGAGTVFFLPDAVEARERPQVISVARGVCCIAEQYTECLCREGMSLYAQGYLDAFLASQMVLFEEYVLETGLISRVRGELRSANPIPDEILQALSMLYMADRYLAPSASRRQQEDFWQGFASSTTVYTSGEKMDCPATIRKLRQDTQTERDQIYVEAEFMLSFAPHVLHYGMPRRTLEIIAAGGFPLAGFQRDYTYFFRQGVNLAWFKDSDEMARTVLFYGNDFDKREQVRQAAWETVMAEHTYDCRIRSVLEHMNGSREMPVPMQPLRHDGPAREIAVGMSEGEGNVEMTGKGDAGTTLEEMTVSGGLTDPDRVGGVVVTRKGRDDKGFYLGKCPQICRICGAAGDFDTYQAVEMLQGSRQSFPYFVCESCGCMQIETVPEDLGKYYGSGYYAYQVKERPDMQFGNPVTDERKILDVGCGGGYWLLTKAVEGCGNLYGCDPFLEKGRIYGDRVTIMNCSIHEIEGDGSFDEIHMGDSFGNMPDPLAALQSVHRLLKPGGTLSMSTPIYPNIAFERYGTYWYQLDAPRNLFLHSKASLAVLSGQSGLKIMEIRYNSNNGQFVKSYLYQQGISYRNLSRFTAEYFSAKDLEKLEAEAGEWNEKGYGDHVEIRWEKG